MVRQYVFCMLLMAAAVFAGEEPKVDAPKPPPQPTSGPGSSQYAHGGYTKASFGTGETQYWIFEPDKPKPAGAPAIIFMHGWSAMWPEAYLAWIEHLTRRGNIVIYPRYQDSILTQPLRFTGNSVAAVKDALGRLKETPHVTPDLSRVAAVGHSFGGIIAANLAALAAQNGLPPIKALMPVEPGSKGLGVYEDYAKIPAGTLLLCVAGADDLLVKDEDAKRIFRGASGVSKDDKDFILVKTDLHGKPPLVAGHLAPNALPGLTNALHWYGFWKWFDALTDAAFYGKNREYALGNTPQQRFMGTWSDGQAVIEPTVTDEP
jgi:acetyl esterase/lipase